jgi:hypothetical protein
MTQKLKGRHKDNMSYAYVTNSRGAQFSKDTGSRHAACGQLAVSIPHNMQNMHNVFGSDALPVAL